MSVHAQSVGECVFVYMYSSTGPRDHREGRGLESAGPHTTGVKIQELYKSYTSTGMCLMNARVEICIEHVRRPLPMCRGF